MARWILPFIAVILAGCAGHDSDMDFLKANDFWTRLDSYGPEIRRVVEKSGYCISFDIRGKDFVFSRAAVRSDGEALAVLEAAGLFERIDTTPELQNAQRDAAGVWYHTTALGMTYLGGGGSWCFGQRTDVTVTDAGAPQRIKTRRIQRTITYRYRVTGMPGFTQTEAFRKVFPKAPANDAVLTDTIRFVFGWKGVWDLPSPPLET